MQSTTFSRSKVSVISTRISSKDVITFQLSNKIIKKKSNYTLCKNFVAMIHQEKGPIASVSILIPKEASKNAVNAISGMFKVMIGQKTRILDRLNQETRVIRHRMSKT